MTRRRSPFEFVLALAASLLLGRTPAAQVSGTVMPTPYQTVLDASGNPIVGAKICTYTAGTTTAATTYTDVALSTPNANPIRADSAGRFVAFLTPGQSYKFVYQTASGTTGTCDGATFKTVDNVSAVPSTSANVDVTGTAGEGITAGQVVYLSDGSGSKTQGQWYRADATNTYSSTLPLVGVAPAAITSGDVGTVRIVGAVTGLTGLTVGAPQYISGTPGAITATAPANSRRIGSADSTTSLLLAGNRNDVATVDLGVVRGRLSLATGTCVTTADVTAATTIYFTPCGGNQIGLYDGTSVWNVRTFTEISIAVPASTSTLYDVFAYDNAGTVTLELAAWTNDSTRATALTTQNGVLVKTGATTRRFLGLCRTTTVSGQAEDSMAKRYLWNEYNRVPRVMRVVETTNSWNYNGVFRQANNAPANQLDFVVGVAEVPVEAVVVASVSGNATGTPMWVAIGEDSTTTADAGSLNSGMGTLNSAAPTTVHAELKKYPAAGRHTWVWLEKASAATVTWYGDNGSDGTQSGIHGVIQG